MKFQQIVLAALIAVFPATVQAQGAMSQKAVPAGIEVYIAGNPKPVDGDASWAYLSAKDCGTGADSEIKIELTGNFATPPLLELWHGQNGTDCTTAENRQPGENGSTCRHVEIADNTSADPIILTSALEMFGDADGKCTINEKRDVYVLQVDKKTPTEGTAKPDNKVQKSWKIYFWVDLTPPVAPVDVEGTDGESEVTVDWEDPEDVTSNPDASFRVYYDDTKVLGLDEACESTVLKAGGAATGLKKWQKSDNEGNTWSPSEFELEEAGQKRVVAVTTLDGAGNESPLSQLACVAKVNTEGFKEMCDADPKCKASFDSCSAVPGTKSSVAMSGAAMIACAFALLRRRRRNV